MHSVGDAPENLVATRRYYHPLQKDYATFLKTSEQTGGEYTLLEIEVAPGGGNVPHYHKTYDEHFEVVEGALEVLVGKETRVLRPGQKAVAGKNTLHRFRNPTERRPRFWSSCALATPGSRSRSRSSTASRPTAAPSRTVPRRTPTTWRCSWSGRSCGCPGS